MIAVVIPRIAVSRLFRPFPRKIVLVVALTVCQKPARRASSANQPPTLTLVWDERAIAYRAVRGSSQKSHFLSASF
jgi:hypothetical protein